MKLLLTIFAVISFSGCSALMGSPNFPRRDFTPQPYIVLGNRLCTIVAGEQRCIDNDTEEAEKMECYNKDEITQLMQYELLLIQSCERWTKSD